MRSPDDPPAAPGRLHGRGPSRRDAVLVTGAGGFVGSAVVRALVHGKRGDRSDAPPPTFADGSPVGRVVAMLRPGGSTERLDELGRSDDWAVERADLLDPLSLRTLAEGVRPRAIVHAALAPGAHGPLDEAARRERIDRPLEVLFRALEGAEGGRVVATGSAAVLRPGRGLDESAPVEPNPSYPDYARHKLREERQVERLGRVTEVPWIHLRLFYLFGRYEPEGRLLPLLVHNLARGRPVELSSGRQVRDYTDVDDAAGAYVGALAAGREATGAVYHVGSGRGISIRDFALTVAEVAGDPALLRFGRAASPDERQEYIVSDPGRARRRLGWAASVGTREKLRGAARWWMSRLEALDPDRATT